MTRAEILTEFATEIRAGAKYKVQDLGFFNRPYLTVSFWLLSGITFMQETTLMTTYCDPARTAISLAISVTATLFARNLRILDTAKERRHLPIFFSYGAVCIGAIFVAPLK